MWFLALVKGVGLRIWGYVLVAAAALAAVAMIFRAGRRAERGAVNEQNLEVKDAQLDAANRRPRTRRDLDRRLRDGKF